MLSPAHRKFLVVEQGVIPSLFNLVLNGAIVWLLFRSVAVVPLWGESSVAVDLFATGFLLPFLTCVIVSRLVTNQVKSEKLALLPATQVPTWGGSHWSVAKRGALLGACGVLLAAVPVVSALALSSSADFGVGAFIGFKAAWAALLAAVVTPLVGWWALAHASRAQAA